MASPLSKLHFTLPSASSETHSKDILEPSEQDRPNAIESDAQLGLRKVQAIREAKVWSKWSTCWLWAGMVLMHFAQAFEGSTTFLYIA